MRLPSAALLVLCSFSVAVCQQPDQPAKDASTFCDTVGQNIQHPEALADACRFVVSLRRNLPNVVCDQTTKRYVRPTPGIFEEKPKDTVTAHVIYEDGRERYSDVTIDGVPQPKKLNELEGQYSVGEFGTDLIFTFTAENHPSYRFLRNDSLSHHHVFVYEAKVARENNHGWVLQSNGRSTYPEFLAELWIDQTSHQILRFDLTPVPDADFPVSNVQLRTEYQNLPLGDGTDFVLPIKSESSSCLWTTPKRHIAFCNYNLLAFKNCHKFRAKSRIVTDGEDPPKN